MYMDTTALAQIIYENIKNKDEYIANNQQTKKHRR